MFQYRNLILILCIFLLATSFACGKKPEEKSPYHLIGTIEVSPLNDPDEIECTLVRGEVVALDGAKSKETGKMEIYKAVEKEESQFTFTELKSKKPKLKGYPYKKTEMHDFIILSNDEGGSVISYFIEKATGGVIRLIGFIGTERPIGDVYVGRCKQIR